MGRVEMSNKEAIVMDQNHHFLLFMERLTLNTFTIFDQ